MIKRLLKTIKDYLDPPILVDESMPAKVPVIHKGCGKQIGWYLRDRPRPYNQAFSRDYMRLDGTQPAQGSSIRDEVCPACGKEVMGLGDMERVFTEKEI